MSGSKEKLKRQEERKQGIEKRQVKKRQQAALIRKQKRCMSIAGVVIALTLFVIFFFKSSFFYRNFTAVEVNDIEYSVADYNYYYYGLYNNYYSSYYSYYGDYTSYMMPDEETLEESTMEMLKEVALLYTKGREAGYTLSETAEIEIEENLDSLEEAAESLDYSSVNKYLRDYYGNGVNEDVYRENLEMYTYAMEYGEVVLNSNEFSDEEMEEYYEANKDTYDNLTYRYFFIDGSAVEDDEDTEEDETVDSETAMAEAKTAAEEFQSRITDEESFDDLAYEYADEDSKDIYLEEDSTLVTTAGASIDSTYSDWVLDEEREAGDSTVVEVTDGYNVVYFVSRDDNNYETVSVRHILIAPKDVDSSEYEDDEEGLEAAEEEADAAARTEAEEIYQEWKDGDATEESFGSLADEKSEDSPDGGLYENVYKGQMVDEYNEWIYDSSRKAGDTEIIKTDYGYHIMYFVDKGMNYRDYIADEDLKSEAYDEWMNENISDYTAEKSWPFKFSY